MKRILFVGAVALLLPLSVQASGFDITHRECTKILDSSYDLPDALGPIYESMAGALEKKTNNPSEQREKLTKKAWSLRHSHLREWAEFSKDLRAYCETLTR
ncbi:hypothetical protein PhaeoP18_01501 [Phaeobacter piscinae]|nr:hypothetical protein PhaeoP18_01501 [Phaeobacter piscinae]